MATKRLSLGEANRSSFGGKQVTSEDNDSGRLATFKIEHSFSKVN